LFPIIALFGLAVLTLALVATAVWSARVTAKALGLRDFRWFDAGPSEDRAKRFIVRTVSSLSGLLIAISFHVLTNFVGGKSVPTLEIIVSEGRPAAAAGLRSGDRIVAVSGKPVNTSDDVRAAISAPGGMKPVEVERHGERNLFDVMPESGRIGVEFVEKREAFAVTEAISSGVVAPFELWTGIFRTLSGATEAQLAGPVGIVNAADDRSRGSDGTLRIFAMLASLYWPFLAAVHAYASATRVLFERTYVRVEGAEPDGGRTATMYRWHQALLLSLACLPFVMAAKVALEFPGLEWTGIVILLLGPATISIYPLVWSLDQALTARPSYFRSSVLVLPCLAPFAAIGLIAASRKHLREAGFKHGFLVPRRR
jgi:hypothetical protein